MNIIKQIKDENGNNIYPIGYAQGGMKMDLLWTNPSPTVAFAPQTISLDLSEYSLIGISSCYDKNQGVDAISPIYFFPMNERGYIFGSNPTNTISNAVRRVTATSSGVIFENGYYQTSVNNDGAIPYKIYGFKLSYIVPASVHGLQYVEV